MLATMTRNKAALTHLLISTTLASIVICLIVFGWYPQPFFWALGGPMLLALIIGIDVVLGPLLTLILFNPTKSRRALTVDMTLIAIVQISALGYGLYSGYVSRLVFGVFDGKVFQLAQAADIAPDFLLKAKSPELQHLPFVGHKMIAAIVPDTDKAQSDISFFKALGVGPQHLPEFYVTLTEARDQLRQAALSHEQLQSKHPALTATLDSLLQTKQLSWQRVAVIPFEVKTATYTAVVDLQSGSVLKVLTENPR